MAASDAESQIERVLNVQVEAWNRGDIPAFVASYAADCIFVGKEVAHGRAQLLARYKKNYPTREAMAIAQEGEEVANTQEAQVHYPEPSVS